MGIRGISRRDFMRLTGRGGAGLVVLGRAGLLDGLPAHAVPAAAGLSDPAVQPKFVELAPNALDPGFLFKDLNENGGPVQRPNFSLRRTGDQCSRPASSIRGTAEG